MIWVLAFGDHRAVRTTSIFQWSVTPMRPRLALPSAMDYDGILSVGQAHPLQFNTRMFCALER